VGPTTDYSVDGRPTTDDLVEFEDLMMFAMNFGLVGLADASPAGGLVAQRPGQDKPRLVLSIASGSLQRGDLVQARLLLEGNESTVKGVHGHVACDWGCLELVEVTAGHLLSEQAAAIFFEYLEAVDGLVVDAAALGQDLTISGSGELAVVRLRVIEPGSLPELAEADLRDRLNRPTNVNLAVLSGEEPSARSGDDLSPTQQLSVRPNPFTAQTEVRYRLPEAGSVTLRIYDAQGRLVRTLQEGQQSAGEHLIVWDGRHADGHRVSPGVYLCRFQAGALERMEKIYLMK
jgi:hypothetical protein